MSSAYFDFKKFRVYHDQCAMKVGTDSVVLGTIIPLLGLEKNILDIGTGSGVLSLILAQRSEAIIHSIEIDDSASKQAKLNFQNSPWPNRLNLENISVQEYAKTTTHLFDLIVCNPPYFNDKANFKIEDLQRAKARYDAELPFSDLASCAFKLLNTDAMFWLILPVNESIQFELEASKIQLFLVSKIWVKPKPNKAVKRVILGFSKSPKVVKESEFILQDDFGNPSKEYIEISKDFYLRIDA
ncbi:MAG: methyltransferase [Bacteroidia bacterium]|nr:methyltransferase [Bacteroidia bacterium]MCF8425707.1 methyltransferase [Bacteroidia bacterium]MCF8446785.1 methyltransferase [Bacteroidia bacterium]